MEKGTASQRLPIGDINQILHLKNESQSSKSAQKLSSIKRNISQDGTSGFAAERNRYHLYVSYPCLFSHRCLLVRKLKGLEHVVTVTILDYLKSSDDRWKFDDTRPDPVFGKTFLKEVYEEAEPDYQGSYSVPVLLDKRDKAIVSNDSLQIMKMLNSQFTKFCETEEQKKLDLFPEHLQDEIKEPIKWIAEHINKGFLKVGSASTQEEYDHQMSLLFYHLQKAQNILANSRYLHGNQLTAPDLLLFASLIRFDVLYYGLFKANLHRITDYPHLYNFMKDIYHHKGVKDTINFYQIKQNGYLSHPKLNPSGIVPLGPTLDLDSPHNRDHLNEDDDRKN